MSIELSLENLKQDLETTQTTGDFSVHDFMESGDPTESWVRANNLAQIALNPGRLINQQRPKASFGTPGHFFKSFVPRNTPANMVHFGSEVTANAALGMIGVASDGSSNDIHVHQKVDANWLYDPTLRDFLSAYHPDDMPTALVSLDDTYEGRWQPEENQREEFMLKLAQFFPDHREIYLPNSVAILSEHSQNHLRDYFKIGRAAWQTIVDTEGEGIEYRYKV